MGTVISDLLRNVFIFIDSVVYNLIGKVYELFISIANTTIISEGTINTFANRVYALLAVFMLFRLSFSVLTYIINPDNINDKSGGGGKLIGNILITIILLISVPWLFGQVWDIQRDLLNDNIIGKIILGNTNVQASEQLNAGDNMAWTTFSAFFHPVVGACADNPSIYDGVNLGGPCYEALKSVNADGTTDVATSYVRIDKSQLVSAISDSGLLNIKNDDEYVFEYLPFISTIAGGFIVYILLLFCIQIAVRSVKLGVLQLIAPIPVISYLDPKQGKDGMFKKWLKVCGKTFADLFIRLAAIYFAIFIITEITSGGGMTDITTGTKQTSLLVKVLIILGALTFAKELPKFIEEITGIKLDGGFSLNPFKNNAILGGIAGGVMGAGMGAIGGFAGNLMAGNGIGNAFRGFGKGLISGGAGGIKDKGLKKDTFTRGAKAGVTTGTNYANWKAAGSTMRGRMSDRMMSAVGAKTAAEKFDAQIKAYDDIAGLHKSAEDYVVGELAKSKNGTWARNNSDLTYTDASGAARTIAAGTNLNELKARLEDQSLTSSQRYAIQQDITALQDHLVDNYMENAGDGAVASFVSQADSIAKQNDINVKGVTASTFRDAKKTSKQGASSIKGSQAYQSAKANANANKEAKASK